jgi:hypothetical protein
LSIDNFFAGLRPEAPINFFAANLGERSVTMKGLWIGYRSYFRTTSFFERLRLFFSPKYLAKSEWPFPAELAPGKSISIQFRTHFVLEGLAPERNTVEELVGVFEDEVGHRFVTGPLTADFQKWTVNGQQIRRLPPDPPGDDGPMKTITATGPPLRSYRPR